MTVCVLSSRSNADHPPLTGDRVIEPQIDNPYTAPESELNKRDTVEGDDDSSVSLEGLHPFWNIMIRPRKTMRRILAVDPTLHVILLACLAGVVSSLDRAYGRDAGESMPAWLILLMIAIIGPISGLISLWIASHLVKFTGRWIGGTADRMDIKAALAWGGTATALSLVLWIVVIVATQGQLFMETIPVVESSDVLDIVIYAFALLTLTLSIWSMFTVCHTVAEAQGYRSAWKGLANLLLAFLLLAVPLFAIVYLLLVLGSGT